MLPSVTGNQLGLRKIQTFEADIVAPHKTPVYASDLPLPERPQDSVPACLLGFDRTGLAPVSYLQFHQLTPELS